MDEKIKKIYELFCVTPYPTKEYRNLYWDTAIALNIKTEDLYQVKVFLEDLYNDIAYEKVTMKSFYKYLADFIKEKGQTINELKEKLPKSDKCYVYKNIFGVYVEDKVKFGKFTIYNFQKNKEYLKNKHAKYETYFFNQDVDFLIEIEIDSYELKRVLEIADIEIENFINLLYFINKEKNKKISVNYYEQKEGNEFALTSHSWINQFPVELNLIINLDSVYEDSLKVSFLKRIVEIMTTDIQSEVENSIKTCINWYGQSAREKNFSSSILKAVIGLEAIFSYNEGILSPSILSSICESIALLIGKDCTERLEIEKRMKNIYKTRSAITHSGKQNKILNSQKEYLFIIIKKVIEILVSPEFQAYKKKSDLMNKIKELKYS